MADTNYPLTITINAIDNASKSIQNVNNSLNTFVHTAVKVEDPIKKVRSNIMGLSFSALFMGMQLNRFITKFIDSAINAYKIAGTENEYFTVKTNELSAAWEFFKFSLIDALSQSELFRWLLEQVIALIDWFNRLDEGEKQFLAISVAVAAVATELLSIAGNIGLLLFSINQLKGKGLFESINQELKPLEGALGANGWLTNFMTKAAGGILLTIGVSDILTGLKENNFDKTLKGAIEVASGGLLMAGKTKAGAAVFFLGTGLMMVKDAVTSEGGSFTDILAGALVAIGGGVIYANPLVGGALIAVGFTLQFIDPLDKVANNALKWFDDKILNPIKAWIEQIRIEIQDLQMGNLKKSQKLSLNNVLQQVTMPVPTMMQNIFGRNEIEAGVSAALQKNQLVVFSSSQR